MSINEKQIINYQYVSSPSINNNHYNNINLRGDCKVMIFIARQNLKMWMEIIGELFAIIHTELQNSSANTSIFSHDSAKTK